MTVTTQDDRGLRTNNDAVVERRPPLRAWWWMITTGVRRRREAGLLGESLEEIPPPSVEPNEDCAVPTLSKLSFAKEEPREWPSMERQMTMDFIQNDFVAPDAPVTDELAGPQLAHLRPPPPSLFDPPDDDDDDDDGDAQLELLLEAVDTTTSDAIQSILPNGTAKDFDLKAFANSREMTKMQERWNALTMLPSPIVAIYFVFAGCWLTVAALDEALQDPDEIPAAGCFRWAWLPHFHAMPPLPVCFVAFGCTVHTPFSFIYHWVYAHRLSAEERMAHWSRRFDQAFIHFGAAFFSFGTSGSWDYFLANVLFNLDGMRRLFKPKIRPRATQARVLGAALAFLVPVFRQDAHLAAGLTLLMSLGFWFFAVYPVGGWSHAVFHVIMCCGFYPLVLLASTTVAASQPQIQYAAQCAAAAH